MTISIGPIPDEWKRDEESALEFAQRRLASEEEKCNEMINKKLTLEERKGKFLVSLIVFIAGFILLWAIPIVWLSLLCYFPAAGYFIYMQSRLSKDNSLDWQIRLAQDKIRLYKQAIKAHEETGIGV